MEIRNPEYVGPGYFACLGGHGVAHVMNAWPRMLELGVQAALPGVETADISVVRAFLVKGRSYEKAVQTLEPYRIVQEPNPAARDAMRHIAWRAMERKKPAFLFINNRLEGHAPSTIEAVADALSG